MTDLPLHSLLGLALLLLGLLLLGCGTSVCWVRFGRNRKKTVKQLQDEDAALRRKEPPAPPAADKR